RWGAAGASLAIAPEWHGRSPDLATSVTVAERAGCDRNPLDARNPADRARLTSYVWPDQTERLHRLATVLDIAAASNLVIEKADAADWVEKRLSSTVPGTAHVLYHTIVWQYLPQQTRERIRKTLDHAGNRATADAPLAWLRFEA